ncbi:hypothetical protein BJG94_05705 [Rhizobium sp. Td3]|nr:hypothetical protein [Rhizobium sp. RM]TMV21126.1 hypothetical protein BJG94_05705 [Rhizobium sp. Td3]
MIRQDSMKRHGGIRMAYDWTGNQTTQQRYDRIVLTIAGALLFTLATGTFALRTQIEPKSPVAFATVEPLNSEGWHLRL